MSMSASHAYRLLILQAMVVIVTGLIGLLALLLVQNSIEVVLNIKGGFTFASLLFGIATLALLIVVLIALRRYKAIVERSPPPTPPKIKKG